MEQVLQGSDAVAELTAGTWAGVDRNPKLSGEGGQAGNMIGVLMCDEHTCQMGGLHSQATQRGADAAAGDAGIDEHMGLPVRKKSTVP